MGNNLNINLIINFMNENKLSKSKFCKLSRISYSVLKKMLNNDDNYRISELDKLSKILKVRICELFI